MPWFKKLNWKVLVETLFHALYMREVYVYKFRIPKNHFENKQSHLNLLPLRFYGKPFSFFLTERETHVRREYVINSFKCKWAVYFTSVGCYEKDVSIDLLGFHVEFKNKHRFIHIWVNIMEALKRINCWLIDGNQSVRRIKIPKSLA